MKPQHLIFSHSLSLSIFLTVFSGSLTGCVSLFPKSKIIKANNVAFTSPAKPFEEIKSPGTDKAWLSGKTGNTISFLSECENPADPSLKQLENDSLAALGKVNIEQTKNTIYNGREALITEASGTVDGVAVKIKLVIVKKNGCNYTLTYGGVAKNYSTESTDFEKFVEAFKVP